MADDRPDGFVVIVPAGVAPPVPLACRVCSFVLRTLDDELACREWECCDRCARLWAHPRRAAWRAGWRPSAEQVAMAEADRTPLSVVVDVG